MSIRSVISVILLSLAVIFIQFAASFLGFVHPFFWVYSAAFAAFFAAFPYIALQKRYPVFGMALLPAIILLALNFLLGECDAQAVIFTILIAVLAEIFRLFMGGYHSKHGRVASYLMFSLLPFANTLRIWVTPEDSKIQTVAEMGAEYGVQMETLVSMVWLLPTMIFVTVCISFWGARVAEVKIKNQR